MKFFVFILLTIYVSPAFSLTCESSIDGQSVEMKNPTLTTNPNSYRAIIEGVRFNAYVDSPPGMITTSVFEKGSTKSDLKTQAAWDGDTIFIVAFYSRVNPEKYYSIVCKP